MAHSRLLTTSLVALSTAALALLVTILPRPHAAVKPITTAVTPITIAPPTLDSFADAPSEAQLNALNSLLDNPTNRTTTTMALGLATPEFPPISRLVDTASEATGMPLIGAPFSLPTFREPDFAIIPTPMWKELAGEQPIGAINAELGRPIQPYDFASSMEERFNIVNTNPAAYNAAYAAYKAAYKAQTKESGIDGPKMPFSACVQFLAAGRTAVLVSEMAKLTDTMAHHGMLQRDTPASDPIWSPPQETPRYKESFKRNALRDQLNALAAECSPPAQNTKPYTVYMVPYTQAFVDASAALDGLTNRFIGEMKAKDGGVPESACTAARHAYNALSTYAHDPVLPLTVEAGIKDNIKAIGTKIALSCD